MINKLSKYDHLVNDYYLIDIKLKGNVTVMQSL